MYRFLEKSSLRWSIGLILTGAGLLPGPAPAQSEVVYIRFSQIQVNGLTVMPQPGQPLLLQRAENTVFIRFENPFPDRQPAFAYRLEPDSARHVIGTRREVLLQNLPPGDYVLWVNAVGTPVKAFNHLELIARPFWQNVWFWPTLSLLILALSGVMGYLFYRYQIRQFMRLQQVRDRIARDLHDDMGSSLSSISILSQTAARHPEQAGQTLLQIGETARQVMDAMSDIVWSVNPRHDTMPLLIERMRQRADELFDGQTTDISFSTGPGVPNLSLTLEQQRDFFLVYKEALTNAARYARARHVYITLTLADQRLLLSLADDGVGFDVAAPPTRPGGGNGLLNLRARAQTLGASLLIQSQPGQGTTVRLDMPIG